MLFRDITFGAQAVFTPALTMFGGDRYFTNWYLPQMIYEEAFSRVRFGVASAVVVCWICLGGLLFFIAARMLRGGEFANEL
jgi:ABC-type sugar transport system permease subunit